MYQAMHLTVGLNLYAVWTCIKIKHVTHILSSPRRAALEPSAMEMVVKKLSLVANKKKSKLAYVRVYCVRSERKNIRPEIKFSVSTVQKLL
mgnify:CR=1 FL=1